MFVITRSQIWRLLMDTVKHISTTDNVDELSHLYKVCGSKYANKDIGNINNMFYSFHVQSSCILLTSEPFMHNVLFSNCNIMAIRVCKRRSLSMF